MQDELLSLDEAARLIPGATKDTLLRMARAGKLTVYRLGKRYTTTRADLDKAVKARRVKANNVALDAPNAVAASVALDQALAELRKKRMR